MATFSDWKNPLEDSVYNFGSSFHPPSSSLPPSPPPPQKNSNCANSYAKSKWSLNGPFYSCVLSCLVFELKSGWWWPCFDRKPPCFSYVNVVVLMLISRNLHKKTREVSIQTRSPPASLLFEGQATKHATVKWSILSQQESIASYSG